MREFLETFKLKLSEDGKYVLLSIRDSETRVTTYSIPRQDFEKLITDYKIASE
jgi:hypothetical protein